MKNRRVITIIAVSETTTIVNLGQCLKHCPTDTKMFL